jgi:ComF family protein
MLRHSRTPNWLVNFLRAPKVDGGLFAPISGCALCGGPSQHRVGLCESCLNDLPWNSRGCRLCALPIRNDGYWCRTCLQAPPVYRRCVTAFVYDFPITSLIPLLKDRGEIWVGALLGRLLASRLRGCDIDAIVPVPIHPLRRLYRGFNQSEIIAQMVATVLKRPVMKCCKKSQRTQAQRGLSRAARRQGLVGSFDVTRCIAGMKLAIIDDVVTSGQTVTELSRCLSAAGADEVEVWAVARTPDRAMVRG